MNMNSKMIAVAVVAIFSIFTMMVSANASHGSSPAACEADGYEAGRDGAFSQDLYETSADIGAKSRILINPKVRPHFKSFAEYI